MMRKGVILIACLALLAIIASAARAEEDGEERRIKQSKLMSDLGDLYDIGYAHRITDYTDDENWQRRETAPAFSSLVRTRAVGGTERIGGGDDDDDFADVARDDNGHKLHEDRLVYSLGLGEHGEVVLDLVKNFDLFSPGYVERTYLADGSVDVVYGREHCWYLGVVRNQPGSIAAISTCDGLSGFVRVAGDDEEFYIEPAHRHLDRFDEANPAQARRARNLAEVPHVVYRPSDLAKSYDTPTCGVTAEHDRRRSGSGSEHYHHPVHGADHHAAEAAMLRRVVAQELGERAAEQMAESELHSVAQAVYASSNRTTTVFEPDSRIIQKRRGATKYLEMAIANDMAQYGAHGANTNQRGTDIMNNVIARYRDTDGGFSPAMSITMVEQRTFTSSNPFSVSSNPNTLLNSWCSYWSSSYPGNDNGALISGIDFDGSTVGLAWVGTVCSSSNSCGINQDHSSSATNTGNTVAHELGHNWSFSHDGDRSCTIMAACSCGQANDGTCPTGTNHWSAASQSSFSSYVAGVSCLNNVPSGAVACPNGFTDPGEECDDDGPSACCTNTCTLQSGAQCAYESAQATPCCASSGCSFVSAGSVQCRAASGECGIAVYCDGASSTCPAAPPGGWTNNGQLCSSGQGHCYDGTCVSGHALCNNWFGGQGGTVCSPNPLPSGCGTMKCKVSGTCYTITGQVPPNGMGCIPSGSSVVNGQCINGNCIQISGASCSAPTVTAPRTIGGCSGTTASGSSCTLGCQSGFAPQGSLAITCSVGSWSSPSGTCVSTSCVTPSVSSPKTVGNCGSSTPTGSTCSVGCISGYAPSGSMVRTCNSGSWQAETGTCVSTSCGSPSVSSPKTVGNCGSSTSSGSSCTIGCISGFIGTGNMVRSCNAGAWTAETGTCQSTACSTPSFSAPTTLGSCTSSTPSGTGCTLGCQSGYSPSASMTITCTNNVFSSPAGTCQENACSAPSVSSPITTGGCSGTTQSGISCNLGCIAGYVPSGSLSITCNLGAFNSPSGSCQPAQTPQPDTCSLPSVSAPLTSGDCVDGSVVTSTCTLGCASGFAATGSMVITCGAGGSWSSPAGSCASTACSAPSVSSPVTLGSCAGTTASDGTCTLACASGYLATGDMSIQCTNTVFSSPSGTCQRLCGTPTISSPMALGGCASGTYTQGQSCTLDCVGGYAPSSGGGTLSVTCQPSGLFSSPSGSCVSTACGSPAAVAPLTNGDCTTSQASGSTCTLGCASGYIAQGNLDITCTNTAWSSPVGSCMSTSCTTPVVNYPTTTGDCPPSTPHNGACSLACVAGFTPQGGSMTITCNTAAWSPSAGTCTSTGAATARPCPTHNSLTCNGKGPCSDGVCSCGGGWTGTSCQVPPPCPQFGGMPCGGGVRGTCLGDGTCLCNAGYSGDACEVLATVCPKHGGLECYEHGTCTNGVCACESEWEGSACQTPKCPNNCNLQGICFADNLITQSPTCFCFLDFSGADCSTPISGPTEYPPVTLPDPGTPAGEPFRIEIVLQPGGVVKNGDKVPIQPIVRLRDINGNPLPATALFHVLARVEGVTLPRDPIRVDGGLTHAHCEGDHNCAFSKLKFWGVRGKSYRVVFFGAEDVPITPAISDPIVVEACPVGTQNSASGEFCDCLAGYKFFLDPVGVNSQCVVCPKGTYKASVGNADCNACPSGTTTSATGSTSPSQCVETCSENCQGATYFWDATALWTGDCTDPCSLQTRAVTCRGDLFGQVSNYADSFCSGVGKPDSERVCDPTGCATVDNNVGEASASPADPSPGGKGGDFPIALVAGAAAGGVLALALVAGAYHKSKKGGGGGGGGMKNPFKRGRRESMDENPMYSLSAVSAASATPAPVASAAPARARPLSTRITNFATAKLSLPPNWGEHTDPGSGQKYYYNAATGVTQWEKPLR